MCVLSSVIAYDLVFFYTKTKSKPKFDLESTSQKSWVQWTAPVGWLLAVLSACSNGGGGWLRGDLTRLFWRASSSLLSPPLDFSISEWSTTRTSYGSPSPPRTTQTKHGWTPTSRTRTGLRWSSSRPATFSHQRHCKRCSRCTRRYRALKLRGNSLRTFAQGFLLLIYSRQRGDDDVRRHLRRRRAITTTMTSGAITTKTTTQTTQRRTKVPRQAAE